MLGTGSSHLIPMCSSSSSSSSSSPALWNSHPTRSPRPVVDLLHRYQPFLHTQKGSATPAQIRVKAASSSSSVGHADYAEEPATNVKFKTCLSLPGCSSSLTLLGTGFREKVFAIIGVKVYAAGFYVNPFILSSLDAWKGKSALEIQGNSALFTSIFEASLEKSMQIVLVRDVDGKTFWDALDGAISPRIKAPDSADKSAMSKFRSIFQGRSLKKGTFIFLTWLNPSEMLVSVSSEGMPSGVHADITSSNVTLALYDVFLGDGPVSPSLKASVASGLASVLK